MEKNMGKPKSTDLVVQPPLAIPLNIDPEKDSYIIKGGAGVAVAHVKKPSGEVFSVHVRACRFQKTAALNVRSRLHYSSGGVGSIRQRRAAAGQ
jgi:hypothetical protein